MITRLTQGSSHIYSQLDEMAFLEGLGSWSSEAEPTRERARQCLEGYLSSLAERVRWFYEFDEKALRKRALEKLAGLRRG